MPKMEFALLKQEEYYEAQSELEEAVIGFAKRVISISKKYPKVGIGDTATDEAICEEVYEAIHSREGIK